MSVSLSAHIKHKPPKNSTKEHMLCILVAKQNISSDQDAEVEGVHQERFVKPYKQLWHKLWEI